MTCVLPGWMLCLHDLMPETTSRGNSSRGTAHPADPNHRHPGVNIIPARTRALKYLP